MPDMLVRLYNLKIDWGFISEQERKGIVIRKPINAEKDLVVDWVRNNFSDAWASETDIAFRNTSTGCFIAIQDSELVGFACSDAVALGFFGPIGVDSNFRGKGIGKALLLACMQDMKLKGYGYAIIGGVGPMDFYRKILGAEEIPDSDPGIWDHFLKR